MTLPDETAATDEGRIRRLLVETCRADVGRTLDAGVLADPAAWASFGRLAQAHGVYGRAMSELAERADPQRLPRSVATAVSEQIRALRRRAAIVDADVDAIADALARAGLEAVLLKGAALRHDLYSDGVLRDLQDLDVLVARDGLGAAVRALRSVGYRLPASLRRAKAYLASHFHLPVYRRGSLTVEIHWGLSSARQGFHLDAARVLEGARTVPGRGRPALPIPSTEHMALHLVLQTVQEGWIRLGRLVDLDRLVRAHDGFDWERLRVDARAGHLGPATWLAFRVASHWLGTPVPDAVLADIRPRRLAMLHLALLRPATAALTGCDKGRFTARRVQEFWLLDQADLRRALLARTFRYDSDGVEFLARPLHPTAGLLRLGKLAAYQIWLYIRAVSSIPHGTVPD